MAKKDIWVIGECSGLGRGNDVGCKRQNLTVRIRTGIISMLSRLITNQANTPSMTSNLCQNYFVDRLEAQPCGIPANSAKIIIYYIVRSHKFGAGSANAAVEASGPPVLVPRMVEKPPNRTQGQHGVET